MESTLPPPPLFTKQSCLVGAIRTCVRVLNLLCGGAWEIGFPMAMFFEEVREARLNEIYICCLISSDTLHK
jgi:hypothetical protein